MGKKVNTLSRTGIIVGVAVLAISGLVMLAFMGRWWMITAVAVVVCVGFHYRDKLPMLATAAYVGLLAAVVLAFSLQILNTMRMNIETPQEWDFLGFWLHGTLATEGRNFYEEPVYSRQILEPFNASEEFLTEIADVGFWYPPPSMLMFAPLGWFSATTALVLWYLVQTTALVACIVLLWRHFLKDAGRVGLLFTAALLLLLQSTLATVQLGQTNFILLLALVLFWLDREHPRAGMWLALGILVKPLFAALGLYLLVKGYWSAIVRTIITFAALSLAAFLLFGGDTFLSYFRANPTSRMPNFVYTEIVNQSLLSALLRATNYDFTGQSPLTYPLFVVSALVLTAITLVLAYGLRERNSGLSLLLILLLGLLIYPATLGHYSVLLMLPALYLWHRRGDLPVGSWLAAIVSSLIIAISTRDGMMFYANLLTWLVLVGIGMRSLLQERRMSVLAAPV